MFIVKDKIIISLGGKDVKMKLKKISSGLILGLAGLSAISVNKTYAQDLNGMEISKEGKYVVNDIKTSNNQKNDWGEVIFTPEKTGVYSLTSTFAKKSDNTHMNVYSSDFHYITAYANEDTKDKDVVNKKVYLEKGIKYYIQVNTDLNDLKTFDFDVKFEEETNVKSNVVATLYSDSEHSKNFNEINQKGFIWNSETNTLTLDNCKLYGNISVSADTSKYDFDTNKFRPVFTIDIKGDSTIKTMDGFCALSFANNSLDFYREDDIFEEGYYKRDDYNVDINIKSDNKSKLAFANDESGIKLASNCKLTIDNTIIDAKKFKIGTDKLYVNNSTINAIEGWNELGRQYGEEYFKKWTYEYTPVFQNAESYFSNSNVQVEMELIPVKFAGKSFKDDNVRGNVFYSVNKFDNSKVVIKSGKNIVKAFKKGKLKFTSNAKDNKLVRKNAAYKVIKSYRNGARKGEVVYNESREEGTLNRAYDGLAYKVVKRASTDGVKVGKVYVYGITDPSFKTIEINGVINCNGCKYKVVGISKKGLTDSKKLKKVAINSKFIKKIAKGAFVKKSKKVTCVVPKAKKKYYTRLLKKSGFKGSIK